LVTSLAANNYQLQCDLIRNGVLWSLLLFMFDYDYTLEESGVEIEEKSNKQVRRTRGDKVSLSGIARPLNSSIRF
jgi:DnaJ homolog subfamily C member 13